MATDPWAELYRDIEGDEEAFGLPRRPSPIQPRTSGGYDDLIPTFEKSAYERARDNELIPQPGIFGRAVDAVGSALHYGKGVVDVAANYYANQGLRRRVLGGAEPIPTGELATEALLPRRLEGDERLPGGLEYARAGARSLSRFAVDALTDPLMAGLAKIPLTKAIPSRQIGAQVLAPGGAQVASTTATVLGKPAVHLGLGAKMHPLAQAALSTYFAGSMGLSAVEAAKQTVGKLQEAGFTPDALESLTDTILSGGFAVGAGLHAVSGLKAAAAQARARSAGEEAPGRRGLPPGPSRPGLPRAPFESRPGSGPSAGVAGPGPGGIQADWLPERRAIPGAGETGIVDAEMFAPRKRLGQAPPEPLPPPVDLYGLEARATAEKAAQDAQLAEIEALRAQGTATRRGLAAEAERRAAEERAALEQEALERGEVEGRQAARERTAPIVERLVQDLTHPQRRVEITERVGQPRDEATIERLVEERLAKLRGEEPGKPIVGAKPGPETPVVPSDARRYPITEEQKAIAERIAVATERAGDTEGTSVDLDRIRAEYPQMATEDVEVVHRDAVRRVRARAAGREFGAAMRKRFGDVAPDDPRANDVEVVAADAAKGNYFFIQRHKGEVVGAAKSLFGIRGMLFGGKRMGSPVSFSPVRAKMDELGIQPSDAVSPYGRDAQEREKARGRVSRDSEARGGEGEYAPDEGTRAGRAGSVRAPDAAPRQSDVPTTATEVTAPQIDIEPSSLRLGSRDTPVQAETLDEPAAAHPLVVGYREAVRNGSWNEFADDTEAWEGTLAPGEAAALVRKEPGLYEYRWIGDAAEAGGYVDHPAAPEQIEAAPEVAPESFPRAVEPTPQAKEPPTVPLAAQPVQEPPEAGIAREPSPGLRPGERKGPPETPELTRSLGEFGADVFGRPQPAPAPLATTSEAASLRRRIDILERTPRSNLGPEARAAIDGQLARLRAELSEESRARPGTREAPVQAETPADVAVAAARVEPAPSAAQMESGVYRKGHVEWQGIPVTIETPKGGVRTAKDGAWEVKDFPAHYGYVKLTKGKDGEHVDVYLGEDLTSERVFVIDQIDPKKGRYDEAKAMLGFSSQEAATAVYDAAFTDGSGPARRGALTEMSVQQLRAWLASGGGRKPLRWEPASAESLVDRGVADAKPGGDRLEGQPLGAQVQGGVQAPLVRPGHEVPADVVPLVRDHEVAGGVVEPVAVDVVDDLAGQKRPAERNLRDEPVLEALPTHPVDRHADEPVAGFVSGESPDVSAAGGAPHTEILPTRPAVAGPAGSVPQTFGEKIGGSRADTAHPLGPRSSAPVGEVDERPAWKRRYVVGQIAKGHGEGRWHIVHNGKPVWGTLFDSAEAAEAAVPLLEVARNHRVYQDREGGKFSIQRRVTDRKHSVVKGGFESEEAAKKYMALHPAEVIEHKFAFPEKPWLDRIERIGKDRRGGKDVAPKQFQEAFSFRGGEFGKWNMGADGQAALNHAYDALLDLADAIDVPPSALSLNGKLAIAFGARGTGGENAARAHYERDRAVINLTKIKGAGTLAHEWFHAVDHFLGQKDVGESSREREAYLTHRVSTRTGKMVPEQRAAFGAVTKAITSTDVVRPIEGKSAQTIADRTTDSLKKLLDQIRQDMGEAQRYKKTAKKPTDEQLSKWDDIATKILAGEPGERQVVAPTPLQRKVHFSLGRETYSSIEDLNAIYKAVTGRSFATADENSRGRTLFWNINNLQGVRQRVVEANAGKLETKARATEYLRNAREIDAMRASDYWSTPHEMGARAFEAFVYDTLAKRTERSDYLTSAVENSYYKATGLKPYPEGTERASINAAFDKLFQAVKLEGKGEALPKEASVEAPAAVEPKIETPEASAIPEEAPSGVRADEGRGGAGAAGPAPAAPAVGGFTRRRLTPAKGTEERTALEERATKAQAAYTRADEKLANVARARGRGPIGREPDHPLYKKAREAVDVARSEAREAQELSSRAMLEDYVETGDQAQQIVARLRLERRAAKDSKNYNRQADLQASENAALSRLQGVFREEAKRQGLSDADADLVARAANTDGSVMADGLEKAVQYEARTLEANRLRETALAELEGMKGLEELTGYGEQSRSGRMKRLHDARYPDDFERAMKENRADNEKGMKRLAEKEEKQASAEKEETARVESLREPVPVKDVEAIEKLTKGERALLEGSPVEGPDAPTEPFPFPAPRSLTRKSAEVAEAKLKSRGLVNEQGKFTPEGIRLAKAAQRHRDRMQVGVPFSEYRPLARKIDPEAGSGKPGWLVGAAADGERYYSNGHFIMEGKPPKGADEIEFLSATQVDKALSKKGAKPVEPIAFTQTENGQLRRVVLSDGTAINADYYDHVHKAFPDARLAATGPLEAVRFLNASGEVVAVVMPLRMERAEMPAGVKQILDRPSTKATGGGAAPPPKPPKPGAPGAEMLEPPDTPSGQGGGLSGAAEQARARLKGRGRGQANDLGSAAAQGAGTLRDLGVIGADLIARGARKFAAWSRQMLADFGAVIGNLPRYLRAIYRNANNLLRGRAAAQPIPRPAPGRAAPGRATPGPTAAPRPPTGGAPPGTRAARPSMPSPGGARLSVESRVERLARQWIDKMGRAWRVLEDVREQGGRVAAGERFKTAAKLVQGKTAERLADVERDMVKPLVEKLHAAKVPLEDLGDYLQLLHRPVRDRVILGRDPTQPHGSGWTDVQAAARWAELERKFGRRVNGKITRLEPMAKHVRDMRDEQIRTLIDGGLISQQQAQSWRNTFGPDYVPLRHFETESGFGTGQGFKIRGPEAERAMGRSTIAENPVAFMLQQLNRAIARAEKNKADQEFGQFVEDNNLFNRRPGAQPIGEQDFVYKKAGIEQRVDIHAVDPLLDRALKNLSAEETKNFVHSVGKVTRMLSQLWTTYSPEFMFRNLARDIQTAATFVSAEQGPKMAAKVVRGVPGAIKGMWDSVRRKNPNATGYEKYANEYREDGGPVGFYQMKNAQELGRSLEAQLREAGGDAVSRLKRAGRGVVDLISDMNKAVENASRLSFYRALRESGVSRDKAAVAAKNLTVNFEQKGEYGSAVNSLYAFFNAGLQGSARLVEAMVKNPKGRAIAGGMVAAGFLLDQVNRSVSDDSDNDGTNDYDDIPEYVKERNLVFMTPGVPLLIPMPYGLSTILNAGRLAGATRAGALTAGEAATSLGSGLWNSFNPMGGERDFVQMLTPTVLDPFVQHEINRDFLGRPIMPEGFPNQAKKPDSEMYFKNVPAWARESARWLNENTGGDHVTPGYIDVSPETIEHYFRFVGNGIGSFGANVVETGRAVVSGETPSLRNAPIAHSFAYEESPGHQAGQYRENMQEMDQLYARYKAYREERNFDAIRRLDPALLRVLSRMRTIDKAVDQVRARGKKGADVERRLAELYALGNKAMAEAHRQAGASP